MGVKASTLLMVLLLIVVSAFAQEQPSSADEIVAKMQSTLNLTQDQVTAVTPIIGKYTSKRAALRQSMEDGTADRDSLRVQMKQMRTDEAGELSQVLSAEQMSQWKSMMRSHHRPPGQGPQGGENNGNNGSGEGPQQ
jgi:outer membrane lipoprotein-sorting protein